MRLALCSCAVALDPGGGQRSLAEREVDIRDFNWQRHHAREAVDMEAVARAEAIKLERLGRLTAKVRPSSSMRLQRRRRRAYLVMCCSALAFSLPACLPAWCPITRAGTRWQRRELDAALGL